MASPAPATVMTTSLAISFLVILLFGIPSSVAADGSGRIGVCYGRHGDDLPSAASVVSLLRAHSISSVRLYDADPTVLRAFSDSGVDIIVGIPNSDLLPLALSVASASSWLRSAVLPFYPAANVSHIAVGAEVTDAPRSANASALALSAMSNLVAALKSAGLHGRIKVTTTCSLGVLARSFPPSAGAFNSSHAAFLRPLLDLLAATESPLMLDLYPYYAYLSSPANVSLPYAVLSPDAAGVVDPNTGLVYSNLLHAQLDAVYFALAALNFKTINLIVSETGWPSAGDNATPAATVENAQSYNGNLIRQVVNGGGTPARPDVALTAYIFSLFNEDRKPGGATERHWGLFYADETPVYALDWTGKAAVDEATATAMSPAMATWCVVAANVSEETMQRGLDWACGPGRVDCTAIQPSQDCFEPDTVAAHASYAFNSYYQRNGATDVACDFGGAGMRTTKDPSYDNCFYMTSSKMSNNIANSTSPPRVPASTSAPSTPYPIKEHLVLLLLLLLLLL